MHTLSIKHRPDESSLAGAYILLELDGLLGDIWHWRSKPGTISDFLETTKHNGCFYYLCLASVDDGPPEIAGLGWAIDIKAVGRNVYRANVGQAFLKKWWHSNIPRDLARMCISDGFNERNISVMYGYTPVPNRAATAFVSKVGFTRLCQAPLYGTWHGNACDFVISAMTKTEWVTREAQ